MKRPALPSWCSLLLGLCSLLWLGMAEAACAYRTFPVAGQERTGIVCSPASSNGPAPVLLVFHGRGGSAADIAAGSRFHLAWPEALVVYLDGLPGIPAPYDPEGRYAGWQLNPGEAGDRDLALTDVVLESLAASYVIDRRHIFAAGHSNGSAFCTVLWATRPQRFAGFAFSAAQAGQRIRTVEPKPVFMGMGVQDTLIPFAWQRLSIPLLAERYGFKPPEAVPGTSLLTGNNGVEAMIAIHAGGHQWPPQQTAQIVEFFKRQLRKSE